MLLLVKSQFNIVPGFNYMPRYYKNSYITREIPFEPIKNINIYINNIITYFYII